MAARCSDPLASAAANTSHAGAPREPRRTPGIPFNMAARQFSSPVLVDTLSDGNMLEIASVEAAYEYLIHNWPAASVDGPRHRDAIDASLKVLDGHRSTIDAENAFIAAAREAEILVAPADERPHRID